MRGFKWTLLFLVMAVSVRAQDKHPQIQVQKYLIDAQINPRTQSITATAKIDFTALENTSEASFELNNALTVSKAVDAQGHSLDASRDGQGLLVKIELPSPIQKSQPGEVSLSYSGKLTGNEDSSPVSGIRFAALHPTSVICCILPAGFQYRATPPIASRLICTSRHQPIIT